MSQHDLNITNQLSGPTRSDINNALQALNSNNSGTTAPATTTKANMHWYDTSTNTLKQRSEADDAWISIGYFDQSSNAFKVFDDTMVVDASGTQTGIIGDQATSAWEAGTGTTESLVSPTKVKAAVNEHAPQGWTYSSSLVSLSADSQTNFTHSLNTTSPLLLLEVQCVVGNNSYSVGDVLQLPATPNDSQRGLIFNIVNANTVKLIVGDALILLRKDNSAEIFPVNFSQWSFRVKARV